MEIKMKALRAVALVTAMGGAAALMLSVASNPAKAAEERLHNETLSSYGLIVPGSGSAANDSQPSGKTQTASYSGGTSSAKNKGSEPQIEDPPLPGYDGNAGNGPNPGNL